MPKPTRIVKVTISLPEDLYATIEEERHKVGETRSAYLRHSMEQLLRLKRDAAREQQDRTAYAQSDTPAICAEDEMWERAGLHEWAAEHPYDE